MQTQINRASIRRRARHRIRRKVRGNERRPRLAVFRSGKHIYAQAIDDDRGMTVAQASTLDKAVREKIKIGSDIDAAKLVGDAVAERLKAAGCEQIVFDRGGYRYHGRIRALADAIRGAGVKF